mmetsp:Transcript_18418/g.37179  ORF Transcript_18418/g.37179 Transcript_18418/m.37179 type:complete len:121 (+) Transcript_18418:376-738(+)
MRTHNNPPNMRPGDWMCVSCGAHNYKDKIVCYSCKGPNVSNLFGNNMVMHGLGLHQQPTIMDMRERCCYFYSRANCPITSVREIGFVPHAKLITTQARPAFSGPETCPRPRQRARRIGSS